MVSIKEKGFAESEASAMQEMREFMHVRHPHPHDIIVHKAFSFADSM